MKMFNDESSQNRGGGRSTNKLKKQEIDENIKLASFLLGVGGALLVQEIVELRNSLANPTIYTHPIDMYDVIVAVIYLSVMLVGWYMYCFWEKKKNEDQDRKIELAGCLSAIGGALLVGEIIELRKRLANPTIYTHPIDMYDVVFAVIYLSVMLVGLYMHSFWKKKKNEDQEMTDYNIDR